MLLQVEISDIVVLPVIGGVAIVAAIVFISVYVCGSGSGSRRKKQRRSSSSKRRKPQELSRTSYG